jgi:hypothetical protein
MAELLPLEELQLGTDAPRYSGSELSHFRPQKCRLRLYAARLTVREIPLRIPNELHCSVITN